MVSKQPNQNPEAIELGMPDATVRLHPRWLSASQSEQYITTLIDELNWQQRPITLFGKTHQIPRLESWYGDPQAVYRYSKTTYYPHPWHPVLLSLRQRLAQFCQAEFNSVLANYYRDGQDSMGWHSDDEPELGDRPVIASVSLGAPRAFHFRHKQTRSTHKVELTSGSLLVMSGDTQRNWQHAIHKSRRPLKPRVNLTFRLVQVPEKVDVS